MEVMVNIIRGVIGTIVGNFHYRRRCRTGGRVNSCSNSMTRGHTCTTYFYHFQTTFALCGRGSGPYGQRRGQGRRVPRVYLLLGQLGKMGTNQQVVDYLLDEVDVSFEYTLLTQLDMVDISIKYSLEDQLYLP